MACLATLALCHIELFNFSGIVMQDGEDWKILRRFTLRALRDFGVGKSSLEEKIKDEVEVVLAEFDLNKGKPFDPKQLLNKAVSNIICSIIFGQRLVSFILYNRHVTINAEVFTYLEHLN